MSIGSCTPLPITPGIVEFSPAAFVAAYPMFSTVQEVVLTSNFTQACLMLDNSCCSVVRDAPTRMVLLNLIVAHITALTSGVSGQPPSGLVGRVSNAQQGSVSVQAEYSSTVTNSQAYWVQTPWGAQFWAATARFRAATYFSPREDSAYGAAWGAWPE